MGKGKLWHLANQKPLNRSSPNLTHVITSWVPIAEQNLNAIHRGISSPHIREIYTVCSHVYYVITSIKFGDDRLRGFWLAGCQSSPFPIDFAGRPYNINQ